MKPFEDIPVGELLLQQPPFRFVDTLEQYSEEFTCAGFTPQEGGMLMEDGRLCAAGLLEHMAQADAIRAGYYCKYILHIEGSVGYIGQVRNYTIHRLPKAGEHLRTKVYHRYEMFRVSLCDVEVYIDDELIASATLKTAFKDD